MVSDLEVDLSHDTETWLAYLQVSKRRQNLDNIEMNKKLLDRTFELGMGGLYTDPSIR